MKHVHTRDRSDGLKETVLEISGADMHEKLLRLHNACGEIFDGPIEAIVVLTRLLDFYKEHTEVSSAVISENRPQ